MDINNLKEYEACLIRTLNAELEFMILGDATDFLKELASSRDVELLSMELHSIDDLGERMIVTDVPTPYFYYTYWWLDIAKEHPDKKYLMVFYVEEADTRAINALKPLIERKPDNLIYGIISRNPDKIINSTINSLCNNIRWCEE